MNKTGRSLSTQYIEYAQARSNFYQLLYLLYTEPLTDETYKEIQERGNAGGLTDIGSGGALLDEFFNSKHDFGYLRREREEFNRLFVGSEALPAPPWESVYRGRDKILFDFPAQETKELYDSYSLTLQKDRFEAEDHIVLELEFMICLIEKSLQTDSAHLDALIEGQRVMLEKHLTAWVPQFSADLSNHTTSRLYQGSAQLLNDFISVDSEFIKELEQ